MKKNIRDYKVNGNQFAYVLDAISVCDADDNEIMDVSDKEKVKYFFDKFTAEFDYPYNKREFPNMQDRIEQYLRGLPNCIHIAFENYNIAQIGKAWGCCKTERKEADFVDSWFSVMAFRLLQLRKYFNI